MPTRCSLALLLLVLAGCQSNALVDSARSEGWNHYGADRDTGSTVALGAVSGDESNVVVQGTIVDVCQMKGCWMRVADGGDELFVRFKDYGFFVPRNATGHEVVMHGSAVRSMASVEELRHYAEDAGKSAAEIAAIAEPQERVVFYADAVYIDGSGLDAPHAE